MTKIRNATIDLDIRIGEMKITKANAFLMQVQLTEPFEISMRTVYDYSGTILEFETGSETGYGEESTIPKITGEVPAAVYETVLQIFPLLL